ncbi:DUF4192 domain-containing protein [Couchioplanes azureus]|uniref:DUF4192 domain-containing protein n=1 Tax=Couchioplanes caeruleus TaxID=56438 RepID=UPI00166F86EA|nr:DUF4192 domain-containing protein [Couchioplanes caeruleus]GGQ83588.1 hypothetical protein GCM10010166_62180 [Couchioplanes caeruleus subsp. azureus]
MMADEQPTSVLRTPEDLLAAVPFLLGYHPADAIIALYAKDGDRIPAVSSISVDAPTDVIVHHLRDALMRNGFRRMYLVGYAPVSARDKLNAIAHTLDATTVVDCRLLVTDGRYYCLFDSCPCTPAEGTAFDSTTSTITTNLIVRGHVALPSKKHLTDLVKSDTQTQTRISTILAELPPEAPDPVAVVSRCMTTAASGIRLTDEQAAQLAVALRTRSGRTAAWLATDDHMWQRDLWLDMTRRIPDPYVTTPANLAAWAAWRHGDATLAWAAVTRAARVTPNNELSLLIATLLSSQINPARLPWPLPEGFDPTGLNPRR